MVGNTSEGYSGARAAEIVGITYRQLDYWARTDLIRPSLVDAKGSGSRRRYSYRDLLELKVIKALLDAGIKLESVREVFTYLRDNLGEDVTTANLVIQGNQAVLVRDGESSSTSSRRARASSTCSRSPASCTTSTPPSSSCTRCPRARSPAWPQAADSAGHPVSERGPLRRPSFASRTPVGIEEDGHPRPGTE